MKFRFALVAAAAAVFLTGCATPPQQPVSIGANTFADKNVRVGVAMGKMPKVDTYFPGADCLLCLAAASVANSSLTAHTKTLPVDDLRRLKSDVAEVLTKKGQTVVVIEEELNLSELPSVKASVPNGVRKDFSSIKNKYQLDKLLVIEVSQIGFIRTYASYIPTSEPKGMVGGAGYIVNFKDNTFEWYLPVMHQKSAQGPWDEAPKFPGLSNAYFQAVEDTRDSILKPLAN